MKELDTSNLILEDFDPSRALETGDPRHVHVRFDAATSEHIAASRDGRPVPKTVLLLGGTGFVGIHLLEALLADPRVERVYAIVRADDGPAGLERLRQAAAQYDLILPDLTSAPGDRLTVLAGDLLSARYGLSPDQHAELTQSVDAVMHLAVSGDYFKTYDAHYRQWTQELLASLCFCTQPRLKHLTYMGSTIARVYQQPDDFTRRDSFWHCGYSRMKWVNHAVLRSLSDSGLPITLCHSPYLLASTKGGRDPGMRYAFWHAHRASRDVGAIYRGEAAAFCPVDVACRALVVNMFESEPLRELSPRLPAAYGNDLFARLMGIEVVEWETFRERLSSTSESVRRIYTRDFPRLVELNNLPPRFPESFDLDLPAPEQLMSRYLRDVGLLEESARAAAG